MKNLKNKLAAFGMVAVLGLGTVSANAGMLISDRSANGQQVCSTTDSFLTQLQGILIVGAPQLSGMLISDRSGMLISDRGAGCDASKSGMLISDRSGMLISD